jgi:Uma2 family endonuclease
MSTRTLPKSQPASSSDVPPLVAGDRVSRDEFHRRYLEMPHLNKAELIEGVVYMPSPVSLHGHGRPHYTFIAWLSNYELKTPGVEGADNVTVLLDQDNELQPDAFLRILPEYGGQSKTENDYVRGAPELVIEVASSSASYDLHDKLNAYRRNGVKEYIVWQSWEKSIDWFVLRGGRYEAATSHWDGIYRSETFAGLWLDAAALLAGDRNRVMTVLQQGLASAQHAEFVKRLQDARHQ